MFDEIEPTGIGVTIALFCYCFSYRHPKTGVLGRVKDTNGFTHLDKKDIEAIIRDIIKSIPSEWETHFCTDIMIDILTSRIHNKIK